MPKDEFDFEDPLELRGMTCRSLEDTTGPMAECFIEEFLRLGYNANQILALFRNPHYLAPHLALQRRGEPWLRSLMAEVFARWGRAVRWPPPADSPRAVIQADGPSPASDRLPPRRAPTPEPFPKS